MDTTTNQPPTPAELDFEAPPADVIAREAAAFRKARSDYEQAARAYLTPNASAPVDAQSDPIFRATVRAISSVKAIRSIPKRCLTNEEIASHSNTSEMTPCNIYMHSAQTLALALLGNTEEASKRVAAVWKQEAARRSQAFNMGEPVWMLANNVAFIASQRAA